ncbi:RM10 protein, partial [Paradoxornis webbianus]|nr:RM10 protein [Sinosuthora webbiana]
AAEMAALGGGGTRWRRAWLPAVQLLRRGSKAVTRHWKAMHFQRQKLLALTEYLPPRPAVPPRCLPRHSPQGPQEDGHARVLWWQVSHPVPRPQMSPCPQEDGQAQALCLQVSPPVPRPQIPHSLSPNPTVLRPVLAQSRYRELLPLLVCRNVLLVSPEAPAREMLRVLKGVPQVTLLGACIDDTILSRQGVENLARLPSLEACRGQTVAALSLMSSQTSSLLQRGPAHLTALLDQHIRRLRDAGGAPEPPA